MRKVPISSIHDAVGRPMRVPQASRRMRRKSRFGRGFGEARFMGPVMDGVAMRNSMARMKSTSWIQETN
jgi:hypothetical protein